MSLNWLFEIGTIGSPTYRLALKDESYGGNSYTGVVDAETFRGAELNRIKVEIDHVPQSKLVFKIIDNSGTYTASNFEGLDVILRLVKDGTEVESWRFKVETATKAYKILTINCIDYLSTLLDGVWPNTELIRDLFPEALLSGDDRYSSVDDKACVPVVFGEDSYIPLQSLASSGNVYYILGLASGNTYTISEVTSPHAIDGQEAYTEGVDITCTQSTSGTVRVFQATIGGVSNSHWKAGANRVPPLVKYKETSSYASLTNPVDVLKFIIKEWGAVDGDFDSSWSTVATSVSSRGISFSRGYWKHEDRKNILLNLMAIADVNIIFGEDITISLNSKTSQTNITSNDLLKKSLEDVGTFTHSRTVPKGNDSGYIEFSKSSTPQDQTIKAKVTANTTTANPVNDTLSVIGVSDSQDAQTIGTLYFQKKIYKTGEIRFLGKPDLISYSPGDIVTIYDSLYGETTPALIDQMVINRDSSIQFVCFTFGASLQDFEDLTPVTISPTTDTSTGAISVLQQAKDYADSLGGDGVAVTWYTASSSDPSDTWDGTDAEHEGDWWYTTDTKKSFRWSGSAWVAWEDADISQALSDASDAQDTADEKRRVFVSTPTTPYDLGDLYVLSGVIYRCTTARATGSYDSNDWTRTADNTVDNGQGWGWITGTKPTQDADKTADNSQDISWLADGGTKTFTSSSLTIGQGADLTLESTTDDVAMVTFGAANNYDYEIRPTSSGGSIIFAPAATNSSDANILIGDITKTDDVLVWAKDEIELYCSGVSGTSKIDVLPTYLNFRANSSARGMILDNISLYPTYSEMTIGTTGNRWDNIFSDDLNVSGTVTANTIDASTLDGNVLTGTCISNSYTTTASSIAASLTALYNGLATKANTHSHPYLSSSHNTDSSAHSGYTLDINLSGATTVSGNLDPTSNSYDLGATTPWDYIVGKKIVAGGAAGTTAVSIRSEGPGTSSSTYSLLCENSSGTDRFWVKDNGDVWCLNGVWYTSTESEKKDIKEIDEPVIGKLLNAIPKRFKLRQQGDEAETMAGFTTENLEQIFPEAVKRLRVTKNDGLDKDGNRIKGQKNKTTIAMRDGAVLPYIVKGQQEQQAYIDAMAERIETLESTVFNLIKRIEILEAKGK